MHLVNCIKVLVCENPSSNACVMVYNIQAQQRGRDITFCFEALLPYPTRASAWRFSALGKRQRNGNQLKRQWRVRWSWGTRAIYLRSACATTFRATNSACHLGLLQCGEQSTTSTQRSRQFAGFTGSDAPDDTLFRVFCFQIFSIPNLGELRCG